MSEKNPSNSKKKETIFSFPHPVNEVAARMVAGMVALLSFATIALDIPWLIFFLAYGFLARVLTGPKMSPLGLLATRFLVPLLGNREKLVPGPPKQFAQAVGLGFSVAALALYYVFELGHAAYAVLGTLTVFALLESVVGFCMGCYVFGYLMRWGLVPEKTCERCNNLSFK